MSKLNYFSKFAVVSNKSHFYYILKVVFGEDMTLLIRSPNFGDTLSLYIKDFVDDPEISFEDSHKNYLPVVIIF